MFLKAKKIGEALYRFSTSFILILGILFTLGVFLSNFIYSSYALDMETQTAIISGDPLLLNLGLLAVSFLLFYPVKKLLLKNSAFFEKYLLILSMLWITAIGLLLFLFGRTVPSADALSVYYCAVQLANGDLSVIQPAGTYLSYYPQQMGLVAFFELLIRILRIFPVSIQYYHFIKLLYIVMTCGIVYYLHAGIRLFESKENGFFFLILAGLNAPLIMYSSFLYGEIPSFFALSFGIFHLLRLLSGKITNRRFPDLLFFLLGVSLAVLFRKNTLIFIIALLIVLFFEFLRQRNPLIFAALLLCGLLSLTVLPFVIKLYELRAGDHLSTGVPAMSYFAMGMQESSRGNGWYNGYNFNTYDNTGLNTDETVRLSKEAIRERLTYFQEHPSYAASFYLQKFLSQWSDGSFACRQATLATYGGRSHFFDEVYEGSLSLFFIHYCNWYQMLLYLGTLYYLYDCLRRRLTLKLYSFLPLIGAFGGFLFHMIWEANSRYIFLYGLCFLPYGAIGLFRLLPCSLKKKEKGKDNDQGK